MTEPVFSIITTTENNRTGLNLTGKSLLQQFDAPVFEWIIIDGASHDKTSDLVRAWDRDMIRFVSKHVRNISHANNIGIDMATGRFIWFMPAGDCFSDMYVLRDIYREYRRNLQAELLYGDARDNGIIHKAKNFDTLMRRPIIPFQAMLYRRNKIDTLRWDEALRESADYDFTLRFQDNTSHIHYMPRLLCDIDTSRRTIPETARMLHEQRTIRAQAFNMPSWKNTVLYYWDKLRHKLHLKLRG